MALRWTADEFKEEFGKKISELIEIRKHITEGHKIEVLQNPGVAQLKAEFGRVRLSQAVEHFYMCECKYWYEQEGGRFRAIISALTIYETEDEQAHAMIELQGKEPPQANLN